jgi:hypothetical protein
MIIADQAMHPGSWLQLLNERNLSERQQNSLGWDNDVSIPIWESFLMSTQTKNKPTWIIMHHLFGGNPLNPQCKGGHFLGEQFSRLTSYYIPTNHQSLQAVLYFSVLGQNRNTATGHPWATFALIWWFQKPAVETKPPKKKPEIAP